MASEKESVPLGKELELVDAYLDVERARFGHRLSVRQEVAEEAREVQVPPLILQPVVENAVRHGISPSVDGGTVSIGAVLDEGVLTITVEDDGAGVDSEDIETLLSRGYGLRNVRDRLNARFGAGDWFRFEGGSGRGTRVRLVIPIEST